MATWIAASAQNEGCRDAELQCIPLQLVHCHLWPPKIDQKCTTNNGMSTAKPINRITRETAFKYVSDACLPEIAYDRAWQEADTTERNTRRKRAKLRSLRRKIAEAPKARAQRLRTFFSGPAHILEILIFKAFMKSLCRQKKLYRSTITHACRQSSSSNCSKSKAIFPSSFEAVSRLCCKENRTGDDKKIQ